MVARLRGVRVEATHGVPVDPSLRYRFGAIFASGGFGRIRRAYDRKLRRDVAVKELHQFQAGSPSAQRFLREAWVTARLEHPAIVPIHDIGHHPGGEPYYCMKLVEGESLHALVRTRTGLAERISFVSHVVAVADALAYAHDRGIVHRDLKPTNVLVGMFGETVVIDWGLAKDIHATLEPEIEASASSQSMDTATVDLTQTGEFVGTLPFMPPEQAQGVGSDTRADVYAIGALLYYVLSGRTPYDHETPQSRLAALLAGPPIDLAVHEPRVPADLLAVVRKAMSRAPADRYASAKQLAADLRSFQDGRLVAARTYRARDLLNHFIHRHRPLVRSATASLVLMTMLGAYSYLKVIDQRAQAVEAQRAEREARSEAENQADAARDVAVEQLVASGRRFLYDTHEPHRALAPLVRAYSLDDTRADLRRMLHEAAGWVGNLQFTIPDVSGFRYSGSGRRIVTWQGPGVVVWDSESGNEVHRLDAGADVYWAVFTVESDEQIIVGTTGGLRKYEKEALEWRLDDWHAGPALVSAADKGTAIIADSHRATALDLSTGEPRRLFALSEAAVLYAEFEWLGGVVLASSIEKEPRWVVERTPSRVSRFTRVGERESESDRFYRNMAHSLAFSPDGKLFSYVGEVGKPEVMLGETTTGRTQPLATCGEVDEDRNVNNGATAVFTPDSGAVVRLVNDRTVARWNVKTRKCEVVRAGLDHEYDRIAVTNDGESVILLGKAGVVSVLDARTLARKETFGREARSAKEFLISPSSRQLGILNTDGLLTVQRIGDPRIVASQPARDAIAGAEEGEVILIAGADPSEGRLRRLRWLPAGEPEWVDFVGTTRLARIGAESRDDDTIVVYSFNENKFELWSRERRWKWESTGSEQCTLDRLTSGSPLVAREGSLSSFCMQAAVISFASTIRTPVTRGVSFFEPGHTSNLYDTSDGTRIASIEGMSGNFSPDGRFLFTGSGLGELRMYDADTGALLRQLVDTEEPSHNVFAGDRATAHSPDGSIFAFSHNDGTISLWNETFEPMERLHGHIEWVRHLEFSPTGEHLLSIADASDSDGQAFLWDLETLEGRRLDTSDVAVFAFSPGGGLLALGGVDGAIRLYDVRTAGQVAELRGHARSISVLEFAGEDRLISVAYDDRVILWQLGMEERSPEALVRFMRELLPEELLVVR